MPNIRLITRSRAGDLALAALIAAGMIALAPRLRVYFQVTMIDVSLERVAPDGKRTAIATPDQFEHLGDGYWPGDTVVAQVTPKIEAYMQKSGLDSDAPTGTSFDWTIRWSENSTKLDHCEHIIREAR